MNSEFSDFLERLPLPAQSLNEAEFIEEALQLLWMPLSLYLEKEGRLEPDSVMEFGDALFTACRLNDPETGRHFWGALQAFQSGSLLKFVNVLERLQQYSGAQVFPINNIRHKRRVRLYMALALSWEHLRYLAGKDDDYSPSGDILQKYGVDLDDHEH
ncbi:MAG: hypothetical protein VXZ35_09960 [Pseudomonadota bacterium]|nr:hypothetical protein [Pseudomonadota bacterium]